MSFNLSLAKLSCERDERLLFEGLTHIFHAGSITQVAGFNGVGKTTLLKIIVGLIAPASGEVTWSLSGDSDNQQPQNIHDSLLYIGHCAAVKAALTAVENTRWFFGLNGTKASSEHLSVPSYQQCVDALAKVGLAGYEDALCYQMSAGQQRRVALARLYLSLAPLWILDEPLTAIDKEGALALQKTMEAHASRGGIVVLTTHQPLAMTNVNVLDLSNYIPRREGDVYA